MSFGSLNSYILRIEYVHIGVYIFFFFDIQKLQRLSTSFEKRGDAREFKIIFFVKVLLHVSSRLFFNYLQKSRVATKSGHSKYIHRILHPCSSSRTQKVCCVLKSHHTTVGYIILRHACFKVCFESS